MLVEPREPTPRKWARPRSSSTTCSARLQPGIRSRVARVKSRSFSEKDIIAKVTFDKSNPPGERPEARLQGQDDAFVKSVRGSGLYGHHRGSHPGRNVPERDGRWDEDHPDLLRHAEELDKVTVGEFPINLKTSGGGAQRRQVEDRQYRPARYWAARGLAERVVAAARRSGASSTTSSASTRVWKG